jgi:hypothetical protein
VTVPFWFTVKAAASRVNVPDAAPAAIASGVGAESRGLVVEIVTLAPPARAGLVSVTVHVEDDDGASEAGLHETAETNTGATRLMVALAELLL